MSGKKLKLAVFLCLVLLGLYVRLRGLMALPFWVDEAESSINALTILEHGVPVDHYQGLPLYENTLTERWPESKEYEFHDGSYSRGVAVYHGWLPLYAIAGSLKLFHVEPQPEAAGFSFRADRSERLKRTWAPRVPSVLFGILGLIAIYFAGYGLGGKEAAWAALIAGAFAANRVEIDLQARYYAATVALSTACTLAVWLVCTRRRWRDVALCAGALTLLFYTHLLTFADHCLVLALFATGELIWRRRAGDVRKFASLALAVAALTLPWLAATGFLAHSSSLPRAWPMLHLREDLTSFLIQRADHAALLAIALAFIAMIVIFRRRLPAVWSVSLAEFALPAAYLSVQIVIAAGLFVYQMPAASLYWNRLTLSVTAPLFLLQALMLAVLARAVSRRHAVAIASLASILLLAVSGRVRTLDPPPHTADEWRIQNAALDFLEKENFPSHTLLFSLPNENLMFSYLSGLPIQSIAPVRKSFLDAYPGPIFFMDSSAASFDKGDPLDPPQLRLAAQTAGQNLTPRQAAQLSAIAGTQLFRNDLAPRCARLLPDADYLPEYARTAMGLQANLIQQRVNHLIQMNRELPLLRGYEIKKMSDFWPMFPYRFVNPKKRMGVYANYAGRLRNSTARILEGTPWVYFISPAP